MRLFLSLIAGILLVLICACTAFPGGSRIEPNAVQPDRQFINGLLSGKSSTLNLFVVHGMGDTDEFEYEEIIKKAPKEAKVSWDTNSSSSPLIKEIRITPRYFTGEAFDCRTPEECKTSEMGQLYKTSFTAGTKTVNLYAYYWHKDAKETFQDKYTTPDKKEGGAWINRSLKNMVIVDGFSDAAIYLGEPGGMLREGVESAMCAMVSDVIGKEAFSTPMAGPCRWNELGSVSAVSRRLQDQTFAMISFSLGSRILFDGLLPRRQLDELERLAPSILNSEQLLALRALEPSGDVSQQAADLRDAFESCSDDSRSRSDDQDAQMACRKGKEAIKDIRLKRYFARNVTQVHMAANQLPLLGLGAIQVYPDKEGLELRNGLYRLFIDPTSTNAAFDMSSELSPASPVEKILIAECGDPSPFAYFNCVQYERAKKNPGITDISAETVPFTQFVAFRDPNDLLGFRAAAHFSHGANRINNVVEIRHRNASVILGSLALPHKAHAREAVSKQSAKIIWCGADIEPSGKVRPRSCEAR